MERCQLELFVEKYFHLDEKKTTEKTLINTDFGQLVNMLSMFKEREQIQIKSDKQQLQQADVSCSLLGSHSYYRTMNQPFPRTCTKCGEVEKANYY